jgi:hypothetical protein
MQVGEGRRYKTARKGETHMNMVHRKLRELDDLMYRSMSHASCSRIASRLRKIIERTESFSYDVPAGKRQCVHPGCDNRKYRGHERCILHHTARCDYCLNEFIPVEHAEDLGEASVGTFLESRRTKRFTHQCPACARMIEWEETLEPTSRVMLDELCRPNHMGTSDYRRGRGYWLLREAYTRHTGRVLPPLAPPHTVALRGLLHTLGSVAPLHKAGIDTLDQLLVEDLPGLVGVHHIGELTAARLMEEVQYYRGLCGM